MVAELAVGVEAGLVVAGTEVGEPGGRIFSRCQMMTRMERATAT